MPSVVPNDNDLVARLAAMERRVQALEGRRRADRPACSVAGPGSTSYGTGVQTLNLVTTTFDTHGMVDLTNDRITVPFSGIWQVVVDIPASYSGLFRDTYFYVRDIDAATDLKTMLSPLNVTTSVVFYLSLNADQRLSLRFNPTIAATSINSVNWSLAYERPA